MNERTKNPPTLITRYDIKAYDTLRHTYVHTQERGQKHTHTHTNTEHTWNYIV